MPPAPQAPSSSLDRSSCPRPSVSRRPPRRRAPGADPAFSAFWPRPRSEPRPACARAAARHWVRPEPACLSRPRPRLRRALPAPSPTALSCYVWIQARAAGRVGAVEGLRAGAAGRECTEPVGREGRARGRVGVASPHPVSCCRWVVQAARARRQRAELLRSITLIRRPRHMTQLPTHIPIFNMFVRGSHTRVARRRAVTLITLIRSLAAAPNSTDLLIRRKKERKKDISE